MADTKSKIYYIPEGSPVAPDKFDVRVRNRQLSGGHVTYTELKNHLESLPDDTAYADSRSYDAVVNDDSVEVPEAAPVAGVPEGGSATH